MSSRRTSHRPLPRRRASSRKVLAVVFVAVAAAAVGTVVAGRAPDTVPGQQRTSSTAPWAAATGAAAEGEIPDGTDLQPVEVGVPAVGRLEPSLRVALVDAFAAARADGLTLYVNSGWRSPALQERLLDEAEAKYGSREEALRWVSPPEISHHVSGKAADLGPFAGVGWLEEHSAEFGLCRLYSNEWWHYEVATTRGGVCPAELPNAAAVGA